MKKLISSIMCIFLALSVTACSHKSASQALPSSSHLESGGILPETMSREGPTLNDALANEATKNDAILGSNLSAPFKRKIIYEAHLNLEALDFDAAINSILQKLEQIGGHISTSSIDGKKGESNRFAEYTLRVPQQYYNEYKSDLAELTNVLSQKENANDITSEYVDIEARLKSLHIQEERLLAMMASAGELETLLAIQNQLADVQYRIESITAQKNTYDKLTQYATINITLYEVSRITETQKDSFMQRAGIAFRESWVNFAEGVQKLTINIVYALPTLLIFALFIIMILLVVKKLNVKKKIEQNITKPKENTDNK